MLPTLKRRQGCQQFPEQNKDEQAISESSLNKLVGAADMYDLKVQVKKNVFLFVLPNFKQFQQIILLFLPICSNCIGNGAPRNPYV